MLLLLNAILFFVLVFYFEHYFLFRQPYLGMFYRLACRSCLTFLPGWYEPFFLGGLHIFVKF